MRIEDYDGQHYEGIRILDEDDEYIVNKDEQSYQYGGIDFWTPQQIVPDDQHIIGFRLYEGPYFIQNMSFLLGKNEHSGIFSEMHFPPLEVYPSLDLFKSKYPESFAAPHYVTLGWNGDHNELSEVKLVFTDGSQTTFESAYYNRDRINQETNEIEEHIKWISLKRNDFDRCFGIRFYGESLNIILDSESPRNYENPTYIEETTPSWSALQEVEEGYQIIGLKANTSTPTH